MGDCWAVCMPIGIFDDCLGVDISIEGQSQALNIGLRLLVGLAGMCLPGGVMHLE